MKLIIADDHEMIRAGLSAKLSQVYPDAEIVEACGFDELRDHYSSEAHIDLAIVDLKMPDGDWRAELRALREGCPDMRIIILSGLETGAVVRQVLPDLADGFIPKSADAQTLINAISMVLQGGCYVPLTALQPIAPDPEIEIANSSAGQIPLTERQRDVLRLIAIGKANKQIAYELGVSVGTVKIHVSGILAALGATNRTEALVLARQRFGFGEARVAS